MKKSKHCAITIFFVNQKFSNTKSSKFYEDFKKGIFDNITLFIINVVIISSKNM